MPQIELEHMYKVFGSHADEALELLQQGVGRDEVQEKTGAVGAVIDASFGVDQGEIFVVMGLSGSGKSTVVRTINRLFEPTAGTVRIDGENITKMGSKELRRLRAEKISMVFQHFGLFPHRTVLENAAWGLEVQKVAGDERIRRAEESLDLVGLSGWGDSYPGQLSGGMQQRVGLARALATNADILLMDEAFSALDPLIRREMQDQLVDLQENLHKTIVFITHDLNEAMRLGDRIAMMKDGRIVQIGTGEDILSDPANDYVASFVSDVDRARVLTAEAVMEEPIAVMLKREGPAAAMREMRQRQVSGLFILGPGRKLIGATLDDQVIEAIRRGDVSLDNITHTEIPAVAPDTPLAELFLPSAKSVLPLPVVKDGRLLGVIPRVTLLAALARTKKAPRDLKEIQIPSEKPSAEGPDPDGEGPDQEDHDDLREAEIPHA